MLLNYTSNEPLYIVGNSVVTQELVFFVEQEISNVQQITVEEALNLPNNSQCIIGFQNLTYRINFLQKTKNLNFRWPTFIHKSAVVVEPKNLNAGIVVHPTAFVGYNVKIGNHSILCPQVTVGHGSFIGENNVVSPGTVIGGSTITGNNVFFGQASSIKNKLSIIDNVEFYMNSTVTKNIIQSGTYYGNRKITNVF